MKKFFILLCLTCVCLFAKESAKEILVIQSYHRGYKWSDDISKVMEKNFLEKENIFLSTVYMDTKRTDSPEYLEDFYHYYKSRFINNKFDIVVAVDNSALDFIKNNYKELFEDVPIVFLGINNFNNTMIWQQSNL